MKKLKKNAPIVRAFVLLFLISAAVAAREIVPEQGFKKAKQAVKKDVATVIHQKEAVAECKEELKEVKKAGDQRAAIIARKELIMAKADLSQSKEYLRADKKKLIRYHDAELQASAKQARLNRQELSNAKKQIRKDLRKDEVETLAMKAENVMKLKLTLDNSLAELQNRQSAYDAEMTALNDELAKTKDRGGFFHLLRELRKENLAVRKAQPESDKLATL